LALSIAVKEKTELNMKQNSPVFLVFEIKLELSIT
jgi:hypothetical protein